MAIKQISVFVENQKGKLVDTVRVLADNEINIRAMSIADTKDFGILRLITSDNEKSLRVLSEESVVNTTEVIAAKLQDRVGSLYRVIDILAKADINLEYMYAFTASKVFGAYVVLRVDDVEHAEEVLKFNGVPTLTEDDITEM